MFKRGDRIELEITDFAFGGKGISKIDTDAQRTMVFVPNTFPGQKVKVAISAKKKKHYEAKLLDKDGNLIEGPFNDSGERTVTVYGG